MNKETYTKIKALCDFYLKCDYLTPGEAHRAARTYMALMVLDGQLNNDGDGSNRLFDINDEAVDAELIFFLEGAGRELCESMNNSVQITGEMVQDTAQLITHADSDCTGVIFFSETGWNPVGYVALCADEKVDDTWLNRAFESL